MTYIKDNNYVFFPIILFTGFTIMDVSKYGEEKTYTEITMTEGNPLWRLASNHGDNTPTHQWTTEVMTLNNLSTSSIKYGEDLHLPAVTHRSLRDDRFGTQIAGGNR